MQRISAYFENSRWNIDKMHLIDDKDIMSVYIKFWEESMLVLCSTFIAPEHGWKILYNGLDPA